LRQNWILKKIGNTILGDLSYKSAGSRFPHTGIFEVSKSEDPIPGSSGEMIVVEGHSKPSMIKVTIPTELEGTAYIQVTIQKGEDILFPYSSSYNKVTCVSHNYRSRHFMPF